MKKKIVLLSVVSLMLLSMTVLASKECGNWHCYLDLTGRCQPEVRECGKDENGWRSGWYRLKKYKRRCVDNSGEVTFEHEDREFVYDCGC